MESARILPLATTHLSLHRDVACLKTALKLARVHWGESSKVQRSRSTLSFSLTFKGQKMKFKYNDKIKFNDDVHLCDVIIAKKISGKP